MNQSLQLMKSLDIFLKDEPLKVLKDHRYIAVEIPGSKKMYYVTIEVLGKEPLDFMIKIFPGDLGLSHLSGSFDEQSKTVDFRFRADVVLIIFDEEVEPFSKEQEYFFKDNTFESYEKIGYPEILYKEKGFMSRPVEREMISDLTLVFEALKEQPIKRLKEIKNIHKNTVFETIFKKSGQWKKEKRRVKINYEKIKCSALESYPLMKRTECVDDSWYITSIYESNLMEENTLIKGKEVLVFPGSVHILEPEGMTINSKFFTGSKKEIPRIKETLVDTLRTYNIRPKKVITNLKSIYYAIKDFLKSLDIETVYKPGDPFITDFAEDYFFREMDDITHETEIYLQKVMDYFLQTKGISRGDFDKMTKEKIEVLADEFHKVTDPLIDAFDEKMLNDDGLRNLSDGKIMAAAFDFVVAGIDKQVKP